MTRRGTTLVEAIIVLGLTVLLASVCVPLVTRSLRTTLQVTGRAGLQTGMRGALENVIRDLHQSHLVLERAGGTLVLFRPDATAVRMPEAVVGVNRADASGLPHFPMAGISPESGKHILIPGVLVRYRLDASKSELVQTRQEGRIVGAVATDTAKGRTSVTSWTFEHSEEPKSRTLASGVIGFEPVAFAYGAAGRLVRAADPTAAAGVVVRMKGSVTPEGDKPDKPVIEEIVAKGWLMRRLSEAIHDGSSAAYDEALDF